MYDLAVTRALGNLINQHLVLVTLAETRVTAKQPSWSRCSSQEQLIIQSLGLLMSMDFLFDLTVVVLQFHLLHPLFQGCSGSEALRGIGAAREGCPPTRPSLGLLPRREPAAGILMIGHVRSCGMIYWPCHCGDKAGGGQPDNPPNGWVGDAPSMAQSGTPKCGKMCSP